MRAVVQRVRSASVTCVGEGEVITLGAIGVGLVVLIGVSVTDGRDAAEWLASKIMNLRIFADADGRLNRSLLETGGQALLVTNFTLYADCEHGRKPSFMEAARGDPASALYRHFCDQIERQGIFTARGRFGADMQVSLINDGPVTLVIDSPVRHFPAGKEPSAREIVLDSATSSVEVL